MKQTISIGLVAVLAFAGGALAAVTTVNLANSTITGVRVTDADGDRIPDLVESELCSRKVARDQLILAEAGRCANAKDFLPPEERHVVPLYLTITSGPDADKDLVPSSVRLVSTTVTIDPFQTKDRVVRLSTSSDSIDVPVDTDDADASQPVPTKVSSTIEVPVDVVMGRDGDRDLVPGNLAVKWSTITVDRTNLKPIVKLSTPTTQAMPVDENDKNPDVPAASMVEMSIPMQVRHSADMDNDLLPGSVSVAMDSYRFDRRLGSLELTYLGRSSSSKTIDQDERDRDNTIPMSAIDADVDFIPDSVESLICMIQSETSASDGRCVGSDGSGEDGSGSNFIGPAGVENPWSFRASS
jgi:hypothetical protein